MTAQKDAPYPPYAKYAGYAVRANGLWEKYWHNVTTDG
jgi:hypothetical protein